MTSTNPIYIALHHHAVCAAHRHMLTLAELNLLARLHTIAPKDWTPADRQTLAAAAVRVLEEKARP